MKKLFIFTSILLLLAGCGSIGGPDFGSAEFEKDDYQLITEANNRFAFDLLDELVQLDEDPNTFFSPISIHSALSMTYNGAAGNTKSEMADVLHIKDFQLEEVNRAYASFLSHTLNRDYEATLNMANSLWLKQGYPFLEEFVTNTEDYYLARVEEMDFQDPKSKDVMNDWVKDHTNGKIKKIIEEVRPNTVAYLMNAIYFLGEWEHAFDKDQSFEDVFYLEDGQSKPQTFMRQTEKFRYYEDHLMQAIDLPYENEEVSMIIMLPKEDKNLDAFYQNLSFEQWNSWVSQFNKMEGSITLPKFKIEYSAKLNDPLINLGMPEAFSGDADFSKMVENGGILIDEVLHKSYIDVNEKGTEAAAATSISMKEMAAPEPIDTFTMTVNRPFFFVIQDNETGILLFMGEINAPELSD